jgi:hypothetical protein
MAARTLRPKHSDEIRAKIQASQLINRLQDHVFKDKSVTSTQMKAIEILLRKSVPDLSNVQLTGPNGGDVPLSVTITHVKPERTGS